MRCARSRRVDSLLRFLVLGSLVSGEATLRKSRSKDAIRKAPDSRGTLPLPLLLAVAIGSIPGRLHGVDSAGVAGSLI